MWAKILNKLARNDNQAEINLLDVKELYDAAFAEKEKARVNLKKYRTFLEKAEKLDALYRAQLSRANNIRYGEAI